MKLRPEQLNQHCQNDLLPVYIISGDEPLLLQESSDAIRTAAKAQGFSERQVFTVEARFDWQQLQHASDTLSLFADKRLIELRLPTGKPGKDGGKALQAYCEQVPPDTVLLIVSGKLDAASQKTKWFKAVEGAGASVQVWPLNAQQLPAWIQQRFKRLGASVDGQGVELLASRVEGNLLAAQQEIDKLHLIHGQTPISADMIADSVSNSSRYNIFELADTALLGNAAKACKILNGLRAEGSEPTLILWAICRELRLLAQLQAGLADGERQDALFRQHRVWDKKQAVYQVALKKLSPKHLKHFLILAAQLDKIIKGVAGGNIWDGLQHLCIAMAGTNLMKAKPKTARV